MKLPFTATALLLAAGTLLAALVVVFLLPKLCRFSPHDHGKAILGSDGMVSKGKPTGTGLWVTLLLLPIVLMVMPLSLAILPSESPPFTTYSFVAPT